MKVSKKDIKELKKIKKFDIQYTDDMIESINLISYRSSQVSPFGSFVFSNLPYAGDIDLQEKCNSIEEIPNIMKFIVSKIRNHNLYNNMYLIGDIKCGRHKYLEPLHDNIGYLKDGKVYDFNRDIFELFNRKYMDLGFDIPNENDDNFINKWLKLFTDLHKAETIRWTPEEINNGYKYNNMNMMKLNDAINNSQLNKIDMYYFSETKGKFIEITNVLFYNELETGQKQKEEIMYDIALNGLQYLLLKPQNLMKYLKRYYSYERQKQDWKFMKIVSEYLQGNINLLNSCATDLGVLQSMGEFGYSLNNNKNYIHIHINNILGRLQNIYEANISDTIFTDIKSLLDCNNWDEMDEIIDNVLEYMKDIINKHTLEFIEKNKIPVLMP